MRALAAVLLAGCFHPSIPAGSPCAEDGSCPGDLTCHAGRCENGAAVDGPIDSIPDAPIDAMIDAFACTTFSRQFDTCTLATGTSLTITGTGYSYDTDSHVLRNGAATVTVTRAVVSGKAGPIDVLIVDTLTISSGSILRVTGSTPFGLAARGAVTISGTIDASNGGVGARSPTGCVQATGGTPAPHLQGPGGGGGAAFHGAGGAGGVGDANSASKPGGAAGIPFSLPLGPIGGCPGGAGADGDPGTAGPRGVGGGAIYLVSATSLTIGGTLHAGGGGGGAGRGSAGSGGGGGSGGMILLESPTVTVSGSLVANGGGGGGGADNVTGIDGAVGAPGTTNTMRAAGGLGAPPNEGGVGGGGGAGNFLAGLSSPSTPDNGGGGGGGGVGYISIIGASTMLGSLISPPLTPFP